MRIRTLGKTGIKVSTIGFGAWQLGNNRDFGPMTEDEALTLVHTAAWIAAVSSLIPPPITAWAPAKRSWARPQGPAGRRRHQQQVRPSRHRRHGLRRGEDDRVRRGVVGRFQTDHLDVLLLHNPPLDALNGDSPQFQMMRKLQQQGKIRFYAHSVD